MGNDTHRIALVTGANRGLGLETCRQLARQGLRVILTSRGEDAGQEAASRLRDEGLEVACRRLDVTSEDDIECVYQATLDAFGRLDVLVNNAGVLLDRGWPVVPDNLEEASALENNIDVLRASMETNTFGAFRLCQRFIPLMVKNRYGRVVNVTTGMSRLEGMGAGWAGYRMSKAALNALTRIFAEEVRGSNVLVNAVDPGWVKTDMGGPGAPRSLENGADTIAWLATLADGGPTGRLFRDRKAIDW